jgi:hypothetical protein
MGFRADLGVSECRRNPNETARPGYGPRGACRGNPLSKLDIDELRDCWKAIYGKAPPKRSVDPF